MQFNNTHLPTHVVISVLKETETQTVEMIKSFANSIIKTMVSSDYDRIISTINVCKEFEKPRTL